MDKTRIALAGLKGGIGKTTLSMVLGSILQETYGKRVCYVDADYFQFPITAQNQREQIFFDRQPDLAKEIFSERGLNFDARPNTTIFKMNEGFELTTSPEEVEKTYPDFDVYIYDFMGSQGYDVTYEYLTKMDYVVLPTVIDSINARPTFYWMKGIRFGEEIVQRRGEEPRLSKVFLLFNQFNDENCDLKLKAVLEDQAKSHDIITLQNCVRHFNGASRDISSINRENTNFFVSTLLQPSEIYLEQTNVHQVAEELFLAIDIIKEPKVAPTSIDDPLLLHQSIVEDLKQQLDEINVLTCEANGAMSNLSEKYKDILQTYTDLCSMKVEEIKELFGRKPTPVPIPDMEEPMELQEKEVGGGETSEVDEANADERKSDH